MDLRCINTPRHLSQLKVRTIPLIESPIGQELCRPWYILHRIFIETPFHKKKSNIKVDIWHPTVAFKGRNPATHFNQLKARLIALIEIPIGQELCCPWYLFHRIVIEIPSTKKIKYQSWNLTPHCGLEVHKPTQALTSVKGRDNIFEWNPKWARTSPPWYIFYGIFIEIPLHNFFFKYQSWYLTPCCGLEVRKPTQALKSVKDPGNILDWNPKWARTLPSLIYFS